MGNPATLWSPSLPRTAILLAGLTILFLTGCAPSHPLYSPLQATGRYGYTDERLGPAEFRVSFTTPRIVTLAFTRAQREKEASERVALAYDMALWRAAELTLQNGHPAFTVSDRTNDVQVSADYGYTYPYAPPYDPMFPRPYGYWYPYPYSYPLDRYTQIEARVSFKATLVSEIRNGAFDANDTITKMQARYPKAQLAGQTLD